MIPKIIHYCWFGHNPLPPFAIKCIESWQEFLPDYEIKRWDESNYDVHKNQYMSDAYKEQKWAFVSDYCRIDVVYQYGGIYLDTDVEIIKPLDDLLSERLFCGFESRDPVGVTGEIEESVNLGLGYGAEKGHPALKGMLNLYEELSFYNPDGSLNLVACPRYQTQVLTEFGLIPNGKTQRIRDGIVYSSEYFCPQSNMTDEMLFLTDKTYSIHHFSRTWSDFGPQIKLRSRLCRLLGFRLADLLSRIVYYPLKQYKRCHIYILKKDMREH